VSEIDEVTEPLRLSLCVTERAPETEKVFLYVGVGVGGGVMVLVWDGDTVEDGVSSIVREGVGSCVGVIRCSQRQTKFCSVKYASQPSFHCPSSSMPARSSPTHVPPTKSFGSPAKNGQYEPTTQVSVLASKKRHSKTTVHGSKNANSPTKEVTTATNTPNDKFVGSS